MLDWLRYFPIAFSRGQGYVTPKGPYFSKPRPQKWRIGDSTFHFKAPWANKVYGGRYGSISDSRSPRHWDIIERRLEYENQNAMPNQRWQSGHFYTREWHMVGPWFTGKRGGINMYASIVGQSEREDYHSSSFFHPRVFETVIADYLSSSYGHRKVGRKPAYRGPLNWRLLTISTFIEAACFDIHHIGNTCIEHPYLNQHIVFPVSHDRFIDITINHSGSALGRGKTDLEPAFALAKSIIDSFHLEVGPNMQTQWESVQVNCPDMSLSEEFAELKWPTKPEDVGKAQEYPKEEREISKAPQVSLENLKFK